MFIEVLKEDEEKVVQTFSNRRDWYIFRSPLTGSHGEDGAFERFQLEYDVNDHVTLTGGIILYQSGEQGDFCDIEDNDRLFFEYSYAF